MLLIIPKNSLVFWVWYPCLSSSSYLARLGLRSPPVSNLRLRSWAFKLQARLYVGYSGFLPSGRGFGLLSHKRWIAKRYLTRRGMTADRCVCIWGILYSLIYIYLAANSYCRWKGKSAEPSSSRPDSHMPKETQETCLIHPLCSGDAFGEFADSEATSTGGISGGGGGHTQCVLPGNLSRLGSGQLWAAVRDGCLCLPLPTPSQMSMERATATATAIAAYRWFLILSFLRRNASVATARRGSGDQVDWSAFRSGRTKALREEVQTKYCLWPLEKSFHRPKTESQKRQTDNCKNIGKPELRGQHFIGQKHRPGPRYTLPSAGALDTRMLHGSGGRQMEDRVSEDRGSRTEDGGLRMADGWAPSQDLPSQRDLRKVTSF